MSDSLTDDIRLRFQRALLGEIYPEIRAIAVTFEEKKMLVVRYYLDRDPTEFDRESLSMLMTEMFAATSSNQEIPECREECVKDDRPIGKLDPLHGFVYARREYDIPSKEKKTPNQPQQRNAGSPPSSNDFSASEPPASLGPRG